MGKVSLEPIEVLLAATVGIGATLFADLWNHFLKRVFGIASLNFCLLGRWISHMPLGVFRHSHIAAAEGKARECAIGWIAHYTIGASLALGFVVTSSGEWLARPTALPATVYGLATVVFPLFIMHPALGLGMGASRTPHPWRARSKSLATHFAFGIGLFLCAWGGRHLILMLG